MDCIVLDQKDGLQEHIDPHKKEEHIKTLTISFFNMDGGTFLGTYEKRLAEWESKIDAESDSQKKEQLKDEMCEYMAECLPYLMRYTKHTEASELVSGPFNTKIKRGVQRKEIFNDYLVNVENFKGCLDHNIEESKVDMFVCKKCKSSELFKDGQTSEFICRNCGLCSTVLCEELSYKEEQETSERVVNNSYKRDNHLNEWILQFQGREMTNIPPEVIDQLRVEFKKQKIKDVKDITQKKVKTLLRKLRLSKYYEHSTYITNILNGLDPPVMKPELEDRLRHMFKEVQAPFDKHCPTNRSNFLSYSYVLYKFCELLGEDEYLPYFPLLKSKEKLRQQDVIWKSICGELLWEYIPTA